MKVISFNINGIRARLHQLQAIIDKHQPDVIGLQEIKVHDEAFPLADVEAMGYHVEHFGQKAHYGVAFLSKEKPLSVQKGFPGDDEDAQRRMIIGQWEFSGRKVTIMNGYFPQGENRSHETKFPAKEKFYADLMDLLNNSYSPDDDVIVMGDLNISATDNDIGIGEPNAKRWLKTGKCSFLPEEREWLGKVYDWGLTDTFRTQYPDVNDRFSWFDYRSKGFDDNRGLRIDQVIATDSLANCCVNNEIDYEIRGSEKPSDHAPVIAEYKFD